MCFDPTTHREPRVLAASFDYQVRYWILSMQTEAPAGPEWDDVLRLSLTLLDLQKEKADLGLDPSTHTGANPCELSQSVDILGQGIRIRGSICYAQCSRTTR